MTSLKERLRSRERAREWRQNPENREKQAAYLKEYRAKNIETAREKEREKSRRERLETPDTVKERWKRHYEKPENKAKLLAKSKAFREENPGIVKFRQKRWRDENPDLVWRQTSRRRASRNQATVSWADKGKILALRIEAKRLTKVTGIVHEVDHIVPLRSKIVCGLHWEGNLQVIPKIENCRKGNRHWPHMP